MSIENEWINSKNDLVVRQISFKHHEIYLNTWLWYNAISSTYIRASVVFEKRWIFLDQLQSMFLVFFIYNIARNSGLKESIKTKTLVACCSNEEDWKIIINYTSFLVIFSSANQPKPLAFFYLSPIRSFNVIFIHTMLLIRFYRLMCIHVLPRLIY